MDLFDDLVNKVDTFKKGLLDGLFIKNIIEDNDYVIIDMNSQDQLFEKGITNDDVDIMEYSPYAEMTIKIKKMKGQPYNRVTLQDEGDFYTSFYVTANNEEFEVKAGDIKTQNLIAKYGSEILGLTNDNLAKLCKYYIIPELRDKFKKIVYDK